MLKFPLRINAVNPAGIVVTAGHDDKAAGLLVQHGAFVDRNAAELQAEIANMLPGASAV